MATCANCTTESDWRYEPFPGNIIDYCKKHLPSFLQKADKQTLVTDLELERHMAPGVPAPVEDAAPAKKKASETPSEEKEATA